MTLDPDIAACAALVERGDPDRFAATMAAPPDCRPRLWPIYALNLELARAPYVSREPMVAELRLQWWADEVTAVAAGKPGEGEIGRALAPILTAVAPAASLLADVAVARGRDAWRDPFASAADFAGYLNRTAGHVMWTAALALGAPPAAEAVVRDMAWAAGLAAWMRAVPDLAAHGWRPFHDDRPESLRALARDGLQRIARARQRRHEVGKAAGPALWPAWLARSTLLRAADAPDRVAAGRLARSEAARRAGLAWVAASGRW